MIKENWKKLLELCDITNVPRLREPRTGEELLRSGRCYLEVVEKVKAHGESERVRDLISLILAEALQPSARQAYGNGGSASISQLLETKWNYAEDEGWKNLLRLFREAVSHIGLEPEQEEQVIAWFAEFPRLFRELIAEEAARLSLVPVENLDEMSGILAEMFREEKNAHKIRDN